MQSIFPITPSIMNYSWGKIGNDSLACLFFDDLPKDQPYAELWYGSHPKSPSTIQGSDFNLLRLLKQHPEYTGHSSGLPFLAKFLSINQALSIQCHPSKAQAYSLRLKDPLNYPDDNHKPEVAIALSDVSMLHGWIDQNQLKTTLLEFPELSSLNIQDWSSTSKKVLLKKLFTEKASDRLNISIAERLNANSNYTKRELLFLELLKQYGASDCGVTLSLFLRMLELKALESIYTPAGQIHAYLKGDLFECMSNSDNVIRAGLTPKFIDYDALIECADVEDSSIVATKPVMNSDSFLSFADNSEEFKVMYKPTFSGNFSYTPKSNSAEMIILESGSLKVNDLTLSKGHGIFLAANQPELKLEGNTASFFRIFVPSLKC